MYAIFEAGGRQHRAEANKVVKMSKLETPTGETVEFDKILAIFDGEETRIGSPYVEGAKVVGRVVQQGRDRKIIVFTYRPKSQFKRKKGHRQEFTQVQITEVVS